LEQLRRDAGARLARALPEPQAGLLRGVILGEGYALDPGLRGKFGDTGTAHIIAVSGSNVTLVVAFVFFVVRRRLRLTLAVPLALAVVALYVLFVGPEPPVLRAGIMGGLYLVAQALGRPAHALTLLGAAAWALTLWAPLSVLEVGFQLSFAALLGILLLAPRLVKWWRPVPRGLREGLAVGVAASLFTYPLLALHFGAIPLIGPFATLLMEPLVAPIMALGWAAVLLGAIWAPLGQALALLCWPLLTAMIGVVELAGSQWWASLPLPNFGALELIAWYGLLALLLAAWTERGRRFRVHLVRQWSYLRAGSWRWAALAHRSSDDELSTD
jgi:competence protein ComEC